jgi:dinuclear metal center YbgI/SA1388 family protein
MTVQQIYDYLDQIAPFEAADKSDNSGLLVGDPNAEVKRIMVCLDITHDVINEAAEKQVSLIISHHPQMYKPIKRIRSGDPVYALVKNGINFIAVHYNMDVASGGTTDIMLRLLGFPENGEVLDYFGKVVDLDSPLTARELAEKCKSAFGCTVVRYVDSGKPVRKLGICSGGGDFLVETALERGCDAYICGDVKWSNMIFAKNYGLTLIDSGHFHTEDVFCADLVGRLRGKFPQIPVEKSTNSIDVCKYVK